MSSTSSLRTRASRVALARSVSLASGAYRSEVRTRIPSGSPVAIKKKTRWVSMGAGRGNRIRQPVLTVQVGIALKVNVAIARAVVRRRRPEQLVEEEAPQDGGQASQGSNRPGNGHDAGPSGVSGDEGVTEAQ